jgi:uncharacterized membrane protein
MADWHPALIHFPIVLLPLSLVFDLYAWAKGREQWRAVAYTLWVAGTVFSLAAVLSGDAAAGPYRDQVQAGLIEQHEDWATGTLVACLVLALGRLPHHMRRSLDGWRWGLYCVLALGAVAALWTTAHWGGELVYVHGVGVEK